MDSARDPSMFRTETGPCLSMKEKTQGQVGEGTSKREDDSLLQVSTGKDLRDPLISQRRNLTCVDVPGPWTMHRRPDRV